MLCYHIWEVEKKNQKIRKYWRYVFSKSEFLFLAWNLWSKEYSIMPRSNKNKDWSKPLLKSPPHQMVVTSESNLIKKERQLMIDRGRASALKHGLSLDPGSVSSADETVPFMLLCPMWMRDHVSKKSSHCPKIITLHIIFHTMRVSSQSHVMMWESQ